MGAVNGWRGDTDLTERISFDLDYIERWSLFLTRISCCSRLRGIKTLTNRQSFPRSFRHSVVFRKGRHFWGRLAKSFDPRKPSVASPLFVNSVPKSGTHVLYHCFSNAPFLRDYDEFIASTPSLPFRELKRQEVRKRLENIRSGELFRGHLFYHQEDASLLWQRQVLHLFVYRDPRDIVCSEAHYLAEMNKFHGMHGRFKMLTPEKRLMLAINGCAAEVPAYPDISARYARFTPWLSETNVYSIRFEELVGPQQAAMLDRLFDRLLQKMPAISAQLSVARLRALQDIRPENSHTYRKGGGVGIWAKQFTAEHKDALQGIGWRSSRQLGYEDDDRW